MSEANVSNHLIKHTTSRSFDDVCAEVASTCQEHEFGVLGTIDLRAKMKSKGVEFEPACTVFEVCNPRKAKEVLTANMDISSSLPCRLAIYTENGKTVVSTLRSTRLLALYDTPGAADEALEVEKTMTAIIEQLAD